MKPFQVIAYPASPEPVTILTDSPTKNSFKKQILFNGNTSAATANSGGGGGVGVSGLGPPATTLLEIKEKICKELGLNASLNIERLIKEAIVFLGIGDRAVFKTNSSATVREKLDAIAKEL